MKRLGLLAALVCGALFITSGAGIASAGHAGPHAVAGSAARAFVNAAEAKHESLCEVRQAFCRDLTTLIRPNGEYYGHDEPSLGFFSKRPGSGNSLTYTLQLPRNPKVRPQPNGSGGKWPFMLRATFWLGMTMCDTQSAPDPGTPCKPNSDFNNRFTRLNPSSPFYIGKHPGGAFLELQWYPPGFVEQFAGDGCTARQYCAAMTIDSAPVNMNTGVNNNADCNNFFLVGPEPVNWAYVTRSGRSQAPANPIALSTDPNLTGLSPDPSKDLMMNPGDRIRVFMHDTPAGFRVDLTDLTTHQHGSMTASKANGFGHVLYQPNSAHCHVKIAPFHAEFSSAVERGTIWTAHAGDVAFSDEIGHWEFCGAVSSEGGNCTAPGATDKKVDADDVACFDGAASTLVQITGCYGQDFDFDGPGYRMNWPGTNPNHTVDRRFHASPVVLTTPTSHGHKLLRSAEETDLPAIESTCNVITGAGCTNPPPGATFYPFYTTHRMGGGCVWEEGGRFLPSPIDNFGGTPTSAYGHLLTLAFPQPGGPVFAIQDFHRDLPVNSC